MHRACSGGAELPPVGQSLMQPADARLLLLHEQLLLVSLVLQELQMLQLVLHHLRMLELRRLLLLMQLKRLKD